LGDYLLILRERIWWLVVSVFVVFLGFALYTFNAPKSYRSVASVEILREKDTVFQLEDIVRQEVANAEDFNTQIKILESLNIIQAVDNRLKGNMRQNFLAPYEKGLDATLRGARSIPEILLGNRMIAPVRLSLVVNIVYDHPDAELSAIIANAKRYSISLILTSSWPKSRIWNIAWPTSRKSMAHFPLSALRILIINSLSV
jgi:uncharacterized protein involved in exopolysaccharide biosynthesis